MTKSVVIGRIVAVIAVGVTVALVMTPRSLNRDDPQPTNRRVTTARIASFHYGPFTPVSLQQRRQLAARYLTRGGSNAVADLLAGNGDRSVDALAAAAAKNPTATAWNDLAAAYFERARISSSAEDLVRSLGAVDQALNLDSSFAAAAFNRALILDALGLRTPARSAYGAYLRIDTTSEWADEARKRLGMTGVITDGERWKSSLPRLEQACLQSRSDAVLDIVNAFPQQSRSWADEYLARWGDALLKNDGIASAHWLAIGRCIGEALFSSKQDELLRDAIRSVDEATSARNQRDLATGHLLYRSARILYRQRVLDEAEQKFAESQVSFTAERSPFMFMVQFYRGCIAYDKGDAVLALSLLDDIASNIPPNDRVLHAQIEYERSLALGANGRVHEALDATLRAMREFENLGEQSNAARAGVGAATLMVALGRPEDAWRMRVSLFPEISRIGDATLTETAIGAAAADEVFISRWDTAAALYRELAGLPHISPPWRADALMWSAIAADRAGSHTSALAMLAKAQAAALDIADPNLRDRALDDIRFADALMNLQLDPQHSATALSATIAYRSGKGMTGRLPDVLVERARARHALTDDTGANADVNEAMDLLEREPPTDQYDPRQRFFGTAGKAFDLAIDLAASRGDVARTFEVAERSRRRALLTTTEQLSLSTCANQIPDSAVLLQLTSLDRETVAVTVRNDGAHMQLLPLGRNNLDSITASLASAAEQRDESAFERAIKRMSVAVLWPLTRDLAGRNRIIIVVDDHTACIPFAALQNENCRRVIDDYVVETAPSASAYFRRIPSRPSPRAAVILGNPSFDSTRFSQLQRLPAAEQEATEIAAIYETKPLTGAAASKRRFVDAARNADLIHIAAHTATDSLDPLLSAIPLAAEPDDRGVLDIRDILHLQLNHAPVVVMTGCRTAAAATSGRPIHTFALAFEAAGARAVMGSLWNVDDAATRPLAVAFHQELRRGLAPPDALREAQLAIERSSTHSGGSVFTWSAFQMYCSN